MMSPDRFTPPDLISASLAPVELGESAAFVPARAARLVVSPGRAIVSRLSVSDLPAEEARTIFAHPVFLASHGIDKVLQVRFEGARQGPMLFIPAANHAVYAERTCSLEDDLALTAAQALMRHFALDYVLYDSVQWMGTGHPARHVSLLFHFQSDWVLPRPAEGETLKLPRGLRQKWSRMQREYGPDRIAFTLEPAHDRAAFDRILDWNRAQVEAAGHRYAMEDAGRDMLWQAVSQIGLIARLTLDGRDIAGAIVTLCAGEAYLNTLGYDAEVSRHSPGVLIMAHARLALNRIGVPVMHLLWGDKRHKHDVGALWTPLHSVLVPRSRLTLLKPSVAREALLLAYRMARTALRYRLDPRPGVGA